MRSYMEKGYPIFFILSFGVFILDRITKYLVKMYLGPFEVVNVIPSFNIAYVENTGSAFGMFKSLGNTFFIAVAVAAMIAVALLIIKDSESRFGLSLILGGAAGNLADRLIYGYVIDFLDVYAGRFHWPAFNVADSALTIGIAWLIIKSFFQGGRSGRRMEANR